jgi:hypothetical protein
LHAAGIRNVQANVTAPLVDYRRTHLISLAGRADKGEFDPDFIFETIHSDNLWGL